MATYKVSIFIIIVHVAYGCEKHIEPVYSPEHFNATFSFSVPPINAGVYIFTRQLENGTAVPLVLMHPDEIDEKINSIMFTGDMSTGNISLLYINVNKSEAGKYKFNRFGVPGTFTPQFVTLFILGIPDVPTVVINRIPDEGEEVVLTCSGSRSTTVPAGHNLTMVYNWTVDDVINPDSPRYTYTENGVQVTINNVQSTDNKKKIKCRAKEDVTGGLSSANSSVVSVQIYYGPENIKFDPADLTYEQDEFSQFGPVSCTASCFPACTYIWDVNGVAGTLYISNLTRYDAGTYTCTATNPERKGRPHYTHTKQLDISVIYGPRNIALSPTTTLYHQEVGYNIPVIQCTSECYSCKYSWSGPINSTGSQLSLDVLTRSHHGRYTCTAMNIKTKQTQTTDVTVEVVYGPDNIIFDPSQDKYKEVENKTLRPIRCTASCYQACTYKWEKIGQSGQIGTNCTLNLSYLQPSMTGIYKCIATNPERDIGSVGTATKTLTLDVIYGPDNITFDPKQDEYTGVENTSLRSISCTASCYPDCTYTWEKTGKTGQIGAGSDLNLGYLNRSMAGIYRCTAMNPGRVGYGSMTTRNISLRVLYGPDKAVISEGHHLNVTEGTRHANITCTSDCYPNCNSSWTSITGGSADVSGDVLFLGRVTRYQTGQYKCISSNAAPEYQRTADATIDITVLYAPDIAAVVLPNKDLVENNTVELICNATGVPSNYNYVALTQTWGSTKIPNPRPQISNTSLHSSLRFEYLRLEDTGTYTCVVNNGVRDVKGILHQKSTIVILILVSPKILAEEITFAGAITGNVMLSVPFYSFPPADSITFTRQDGVQMQNRNRTTVSYEISPVITKFYGEEVILNGSRAYLKITDIQEIDFTNYTLEVTNRIGRNRTVINLITQNAPNKPTSFNSHVGETDVVVSWTAGFHGGSDQTFVIQLSEDSEIWFNHSFVFAGKNTTGLQMNVTLDPLSKGTEYYVRIYSFNINGSSPYTDILNFTTHGEVSAVPSQQTAPIVGAVVGSVIVMATGAVVVAIFVFKRRNGNLRSKKKEDMFIATNDRERLQVPSRKYENIGLQKSRKHDDDDDDNADDDDPEDIEKLKDEYHDVGPVYGNTAPVKPISVKQLRSVCRNATNDPSSLYTEFKTIPVKFQLDTHEAAKAENKIRIRYKEMYAYDKNRVTLPLQPGNYSSDFINASYIRGYKKDNMYIASQGAMKDTEEDVWRMVWKHKIMTIVMLTNCNENNRVKCVQYWPSTGEQKYGKFRIKAVSVEVYSEFTIRTFTCKMSGSGSQIDVTQYHFTAWPDKDVPDTCLSLVQLWKKVKHSKKACVTPWIVHCSAGVGRTGTFIALDYLYDQGKDEGSINVHTCVSELRDQRLHMVQTSAQYVFLHQAALEVLNPIATVCKSEEYKDMWRNLQTKTPRCNETKLQTEYKEIIIDDTNAVKDESDDDAIFATRVARDKFSESKMPENLPKTRSRNILPPDEYRPMLVTDGDDDYINAAVLSTYKRPDSMIITQVPLKDTIVDFVRMVRDYEVFTIVLIDDAIPQDCKYWPSSQGTVLQIGQFSAELIREDVLNSYTLRSIRYSFPGVNGPLQSRDVKQFHLTSWHGKVPNIKGHVLSLLADVDKSVTDTADQGPFVVQCMDGASKSGLFCVMWSVLERLKCEREVAIAESIRFIKARRRQIIPNFEQYNFCYEIVLEYLDSCSEYANVM